MIFILFPWEWFLSAKIACIFTTYQKTQSSVTTFSDKPSLHEYNTNILDI